MTALVLLAVFILTVLAQQAVYIRYWHRGLSVDLHFSVGAATEGDTISLEETVTSRKWLPLPWLTVKFQVARQLEFLDGVNASVSDAYYREDLFSVFLFQRVRRQLPVRLSQRGYYTIKGIDLLSSDLLFLSRLVSQERSDSSIVVCPRHLPADALEIPFRHLTGQILSRRTALPDPFEFRTLRDYAPTDPMRAINWRATARSGSLKVNVHEPTAERSAHVLLNVEPDLQLSDPRMIEQSIRVAATLCSRLIERGIRCALHTNARDALSGKACVVPAGLTAAHDRLIQEALGRLDLALEPLEFVAFLNARKSQFRSGDLLVLISRKCAQPIVESWRGAIRDAPGSTWLIPRQSGENQRRPDFDGAVFYWEVDRYA